VKAQNLRFDTRLVFSETLQNLPVIFLLTMRDGQSDLMRYELTVILTQPSLTSDDSLTLTLCPIIVPLYYNASIWVLLMWRLRGLQVMMSTEA
jgi:hypothetical protein